MTPLLSPSTATGVLRSVVLPSPNSPESLRPQQRAPPACVSAQVCRKPAVIALTSLLSPSTAAGLMRLSVLPSPNCPYSLLPQQRTPPTWVSAQVCPQPAAMAMTPLLSP